MALSTINSDPKLIMDNPNEIERLNNAYIDLI